MSDPRPQELIRAEKLLNNGKIDNVLEIIVNFEKKSGISHKEQLWVLLLRGWLYFNNLQFKEAVELGKQAYQLSRELDMVSECVEALYLKAQILFLGKPDEGLDLISKAEEILNAFTKETYVNLSKFNLYFFILKSWSYFYKGEFDASLEFALRGLRLAEKIEWKLQSAYSLFLLGLIYTFKGEPNTALEHATESLTLLEKMDFQVGIASSLWGKGVVYYNKGDLNKALEFFEKSLLIEKISDTTKINTLGFLGEIYGTKGELNKSLKYYKQSIELADEAIHYTMIIVNMRNIGILYRIKGENDQAKNYLNQSLTLGDKLGSLSIHTLHPLFYLVLLNLEMACPDQVQLYLERLKHLSDQHESKVNTQGYKLAKAVVLKSNGRRRSSAEAEILLRQIVEDEILDPNFHIYALIFLCELFIEELSIYDNPEVLNEINPLIIRLLRIAENQNSIFWITEGKLLQAKLALIQEKINEAQGLLTEAQQIAESHELNFVAQKISSEHDILLEKVDEWEKLKKVDAPMAKRIELASFDGVLNRLQGKQAVDPPEIVQEEPILLLIMDNSGVPYFNHSFVSDWDMEGLFSSFLSAFNTFSSELFSKSIDRIRIGDNVILINPIEPFLACYVIKGQSYPALQKLTRFTEAIRKNSEIWQALNKSVKTSEMLELDKPSALKTVINEIFTQ